MHCESHPSMKLQKSTGTQNFAPDMYICKQFCAVINSYFCMHIGLKHTSPSFTANTCNFENNDSWYFIIKFYHWVFNWYWLTWNTSLQLFICSLQSWNRYSPLPQPAHSGFRTGSPSSSSSGSLTELKTVVPPDPYSNLPPDSRRVVDSVASMGFPKAQAARAVEKLGADQKEVGL